jgi:hypothetical protein
VRGISSPDAIAPGVTYPCSHPDAAALTIGFILEWNCVREEPLQSCGRAAAADGHRALEVGEVLPGQQFLARSGEAGSVRDVGCVIVGRVVRLPAGWACCAGERREPRPRTRTCLNAFGHPGADVTLRLARSASA